MYFTTEDNSNMLGVRVSMGSVGERAEELEGGCCYVECKMRRADR
jgi:hypothetical protein